MRHLAVRLLLVSLAVGLALLAGEGLLRVRGGGNEGLRALHEAQPDEPWLYGLKPRARAVDTTQRSVVYSVNEDGYRGPRVPIERSAGVLRVLVLGDSVAFGYGVAEEKSFPRLLEQRLGRQVPTEVVNLGVSGYNAFNQAALFEGRGARYRPDLVLVAFCVNDLNDPTVHFDAQTRLRLGAIPDEAFPDPAWRQRYASAGTGLLDEVCRSSLLCGRVKQAGRALRSDGSEGERLSDTVAPRALGRGPARRWLAENYGRIHQRADAIGARFAVVVFPHREQVERQTGPGLQAELTALSREVGFEMIDLFPAFHQAAARARESLFLDLWHPTAAGHAVAAEVIHAELLARSWETIPRG